MLTRWLREDLSTHNRVVKRIVIALLALLAAYLIIRFATPQLRGQGVIPTDFNVFHLAGARFQAGEAVYRADESSPFKYSPVFLVTLSKWLSGFSKETGWFLWCSFNIMSWCFALFFFFRALAPLSYRMPVFLGAMVLAIIAAWHGHLEHLSYGQSDFFIAALFMGSTFLIYSARKRRASIIGLSLKALLKSPVFMRRALATFLMSLALITKPASLLLLIGLAWEGEWLLILSVGALCVLWFAITALYLDLITAPWSLYTLTHDWIDSLKAQPSELFGGNLNQALGAVLARTLGHPQWSESFCKALFAGGLILFLMCMVRAMVLSRRHIEAAIVTPFEVAQKLCASMGIYLLANPLSWRWNTFMWFPMVYFALLLFFGKRTTSAQPGARLLFNGLTGIFLILVLFLQKNFSALVGIEEVDVLSYWGFYGWGTLALTIILIWDESIYSRRASTKDAKAAA
jgi:hypothetical protein